MIPRILSRILLIAVAGLGGVQRGAAAEPLKNSLGMALLRIPAGEFEMGSPVEESGRRENETQHMVRISKPYDLGQFEVTRGEFRQFVTQTQYRPESVRSGRGGYGVELPSFQLSGLDPKYSWEFVGFEQTDAHPVVNVSWNDAAAFCEWLSKVEQTTYRLPTEAEWEYACRAGSKKAYSFGDDREELIRYGNVVDSRAHAVYPERIWIQGDDGHLFTAPVGSYRPNAWGLHDLHGNVWEWCSDWFADHPAEMQTDPQGPRDPQPLGRVIKGGDWYHDWSFARSAQRFPIPPTLVRRHAGFRVVREVAVE